MTEKTIRSYCAGRGRITRGQKRAYDKWAARYLIPATETPPDWQKIFCRNAPITAEVGCGHGEALAQTAAQNPDRDYAVFEVYQPGIGALMNALAAGGINNVRIIRADGAYYLPLMFAPHSLSEVRIFFPDPWPKRRHHKRRLINETFAATLANKLESGGIVRIATDNMHYAQTIDNTFAAGGSFIPSPERNESIPQTRFAARAIAAKRKVALLTYARI